MDRIKRLRARMFRRHKTPFKPLGEGDLALLDREILAYKRQERLVVAAEGDHAQKLAPHIEVLRRNHLLKKKAVRPIDFRIAAHKAAWMLLGLASEIFGVDPERATVCVPWRAGLAFGIPAFEWGCRSWYNIGVYRNETTADPIVYYRDQFHLRDGHYLVADPMHATGGTMVDTVLDLAKRGVPEDRITAISIFSAPEGIDRVLHRFPELRVLTGTLDRQLNELAYIVPGCGDFGDQYSPGFMGGYGPRAWKKLGILGPEAFLALNERVKELRKG